MAAAASAANGADVIERAPGVDTLLEGIRANSEELPAFRKDAFRAMRAPDANAASDRTAHTAPPVLLASFGAPLPSGSPDAETIDAERPSAPKLAETAPGTRQTRERHVLVVLAGVCALLAGGAVFGGLSMLRARAPEGAATTLSRGEAPADAPRAPSIEARGAVEAAAAPESEAALAALRAEAAAQLAQSSTAVEAESQAPPAPSTSEPHVRRGSRAEATRALSTVPPRSDISRSQ